MTIDPKTGKSELEKPISAVYLDALAVENTTRAATANGYVNTVTFHPHGSATVTVENGKFSVQAKDCSTMIRDSDDQLSVTMTLSPGTAPA